MEQKQRPKRLKIGIDVDDVIVNFMEAFRAEAQQVLGRVLVGPPGSWGFGNWNITEDEEERIWDVIYTKPNWFMDFCSTPLPGVKETLPFLCQLHEVYFITARREGEGYATQLQTLFTLEALDVLYPQVIVRKNKGQVAAALGLDVFIDDKPQNLEEVKRWSPRTELFILDQSHNQDPVFEHWWTRVFSFQEFVDKVKELK